MYHYHRIRTRCGPLAGLVGVLTLCSPGLGQESAIEEEREPRGPSEQEPGAALAGLRPRPISIKPARSELPRGYDPKRIQVKFQDGLDIGLDGTGLPVDRNNAPRTRAFATTLALSVQGGVWRRNAGADEATLDRMRATAQANLGREIADLNSYFLFDVPAGSDAADWMDRLNHLSEVELAFPLSLPMPAPGTPARSASGLAAPPLPPGDYTGSQGYLYSAPNGIAAMDSWGIPGGRGHNVTIVDLEYGWNLFHQDLPAITIVVPAGLTPSDPFNDSNHGTAVLGELVSLNNSFGTIGMPFDAEARVAPVSFTVGYLLNTAFQNALTGLSAGDLVLFEQQMVGPNWPGGSSQLGLVAVEWDQAVYNSIVTAVGNGIHVIEAAGNGSQDLDDPVYSTGHGGHWPFLPGNDSGALIVGAGAAPAAYGGSTTDRSRLSFSNYGATVDLQGWGERVTTTGYGDLYSADGMNLWFTSTFSGTSSASPIVTSAAALFSSVHQELFGFPKDPGGLRSFLVNTGSPQQSGINPSSQHIGPRPNLVAAYSGFGPWVDFAYVGTETGTPIQPWNTLAEGVAAGNPGGNVLLKSGTSSETPTITVARTLWAVGGVVTIGQ